MLKKTIVLMIVLSLVTCFAMGCQKKQPTPPPPPTATTGTAEGEAVETKTAEEYKAEADKDINKDNMQSELDKLEQEVKSDTAAGQ